MGTVILAKALYTNTPESKYELFFRKGDILNVLQFDYEGQSGWWFCSIRGEKGLCPGNYLEILKEGDFAPFYDNDILTNQDDPQETYDFPKSQTDVEPSEPSVRSSGSSNNAEAECWYSVPGTPGIINGDSKPCSSLLLDDSIDLYDVPRSIDDDTPASWVETEVQLRNKINSSMSQNRRGQLVSEGTGQSLALASSAQNLLPTDVARGQLNKSAEKHCLK